jgi:hypothetical protein
MLWRGATSAWLHVGAVAAASSDIATDAVVQALLRGMVLAPHSDVCVLLWRAIIAGFAVTQQCSNAIDLRFNGVTLVAARRAQSQVEVLLLQATGSSRTAAMASRWPGVMP